MSAFETRLAALVHTSVRGDPAERAKHERFIVPRIAAGMAALVCLPLYLLWRGVPSVSESLVTLTLVMPLVAALVASRTGALEVAQTISSAALACLILIIALSSGGTTSSAAIWFVVIPLEALLLGSRRAAIAAGGMSFAGVIALILAEPMGWNAAPLPWPLSTAIIVFVLTAIASSLAQGLEQSRFAALREVATRTREARDRSLLQAIDDLVTWHDRNGDVISASPAALKLLGLPPTSLQGRGLLARVHVADRPAFLKAISDAVRSDKPVVSEFRLQTCETGVSGSEGALRAPNLLWVEMRAHRIEGSDDPTCPDAVVAVTRDISEFKRRTEELESARASAERADALKGRFLATVSHELRTPLNAIIGFSEILTTDTGPVMDRERCKEYATIIRDSGQHLLEVVNTLLDISKIESGNFDFVPEPFEVAPLVHGCCDLMALKAEQAGLLLTRDIADNLPEFVSDRRACRQILINLLSNAVKFTPPGGRVVVSVRRERDRIIFTVSDTGIGISPEDLPRIGDPFFQAGHLYDRPHEGTGLGLSVVRGLVGLHRGTMTIDSAPGEGTRITLALPIDCRFGGVRVPTTARVEILARAREMRAAG